ncbi:MAG: hypothetical protein IJA65_04375, partial [Acholeplasmatales bacterium]|nr:hypothetical protein [Acholeplasmatales bacterium]
LYEIRKMVREVYNKMKQDNYYTKTVILTLRDSDFNTISRRKTIDEYTDDFYVINDIASDLVEDYYDTSKAYRLVGIGVSNLVHYEDLPKEYNIFTIDDISIKEENINNIINEMQEKFGHNALFWNKDKLKK